MPDFDRYRWLSFDCYGTPVDWESGISDTVARVFSHHGVRKTRDEIPALFAGAEPGVQMSGEFLDYRRVLRQVLAAMTLGASVRLSGPEADPLSDSLPGWRVFPDALRALQTRYSLAIISKVDDDLFELSARTMGARFDAVVTSLQARSYKPDLRNFRLARDRMGVDSINWLHVGESLCHDIGPANMLGIDSVWVKRPDRGGGTRLTGAAPSLVVWTRLFRQNQGRVK